jgi:deoxyhypusine synthase
LRFPGELGLGNINCVVVTDETILTMLRKRCTSIRGIDFEQSNSLEALAQSLNRTGFQASHLGRAIDLVNQLFFCRTPIYLSFTGNAVSSGLREVIAFLVKHRHVHAIVTTASGIEEDAIKSLGAFTLERFNTPGAALLERREYRIGNIVACNSLYADFKELFRPILERAHRRQAGGSPPVTRSELIAELGAKLDDESSFLHWAARNRVPLYRPGVSDGAIGDNLVSYTDECPGLCVDVVRDHRRIVDQRDDPHGALPRAESPRRAALRKPRAAAQILRRAETPRRPRVRARADGSSPSPRRSARRGSSRAAYPAPHPARAKAHVPTTLSHGTEPAPGSPGPAQWLRKASTSNRPRQQRDRFC